ILYVFCLFRSALHASPEISVWFLLFFFFSSRRRHTRWPRDWSSDVCSSDLFPERIQRHHARPLHFPLTSTAAACARSASTRSIRSEERRVGKECRSRW